MRANLQGPTQHLSVCYLGCLYAGSIHRLVLVVYVGLVSCPTALLQLVSFYWLRGDEECVLTFKDPPNIFWYAI